MATETRIATIVKKNNEAAIRIVGRGFKLVSASANKNGGIYGISAESVNVHQMEAISSAVKLAFAELETFEVDFATLEIKTKGYVISAPTGYRTAAMKKEDWERENAESPADHSTQNLEYEMYNPNGRYYG